MKAVSSNFLATFLVMRVLSRFYNSPRLYRLILWVTNYIHKVRCFGAKLINIEKFVTHDIMEWFTYNNPWNRVVEYYACTICSYFVLTWDQALFSFRFENYIPAGIAKRKESLIQTFYETSAAHFFDWLTFAESASQNYFRCLFF